MDIIYSVFATIVKANILLQDKLFPASVDSIDYMYILQLFTTLIICIALLFLPKRLSSS